MGFPRWLLFAFLASSSLFCAAARAQSTNCDEGAGLLDSAEPKNISTDAIIQKFAANEAALRAAFFGYVYSMDLTLQTLNGDSVTGETKRRADITHDAKGKRNEHLTFQSVSTLQGISVGPDDLDDADIAGLGFLVPEALNEYYIHYLGHQPVDQLNTYTFEVAPKKVNKKGLFQGRVWVDDQEFAIVKTCGKVMRTDEIPSRNPRQPLNVSPTFVIYREQVDGRYWFPTYIRAEDYLQFRRGGVSVRETVKHINFKKTS